MRKLKLQSLAGSGKGRSQAWTQGATQHWFCPILSYESTDLSPEVGRGVWQQEPPLYPESHSLGAQGQLKEPLNVMQTASAIFGGEGFISPIRLSKKPSNQKLKR